MSSATIFIAYFLEKMKEIFQNVVCYNFTQYAKRTQIYLGVNIVLFSNIMYLVISLIRFSYITNSFIFNDITNSIL